MNQLYPYQELGVQHLLSRPFGKPHALLADGPGTGKTVMAIEAAKRSGCKTGVILCPAIVKDQWASMAEKWELCPQGDIEPLYGLKAKVGKAPWVVLNYDLIRVPYIRKQIAERDWHCLVMDEAHRLKTPSSKQSKAVFHHEYGIAHKAYWKWALSGTIMPNRTAELYPLLKTMAPETIRPHDNWTSYLMRYCAGDAMGRGSSNVDELAERIKPFMLRRTLEDVWDECPPIIENEVFVKVPYTDHPEWNEFVDPASERRIIAEAKAPYVARYVKQRLDDGLKKIVCFTYHRGMTTHLVDALRGYRAVAVFGGVGQKARADRIAQFQYDPGCRVFVVQIMSGGEGVDGLQFATNELLSCEPEWSPGREDQSWDRIKRLGQTADRVIVTKFRAANSPEIAVDRANQRKRPVINQVVATSQVKEIEMSFDTNVKSIADSLKIIAGFCASQQNSNGSVEKKEIPVEGKKPAAVVTPPTAVVPVTPPAPVSTAAPQPAPNPVPQTAPSAVPTPAPQIAPASVSASTSVATPSTPVPAAQPVTTNGAMTADQLRAKTLSKLQPMGDAGLDILNTLLVQFQVPVLEGDTNPRLGSLSIDQYDQWIQAVEAVQ